MEIKLKQKFEYELEERLKGKPDRNNVMREALSIEVLLWLVERKMLKFRFNISHHSDKLVDANRNRTSGIIGNTRNLFDFNMN